MAKIVDELSQLCPIQFIEGINENEEPIESGEGRFWTPQDQNLKAAIPYKPARTYTLSRIEIFGSPYELSEKKEHLVRLYTDNKDIPSGNFVSDGKLLIPAEAGGEDWLGIDLKPVVVFAGQQYWIVLEDYSLKFAIGIARSGEEAEKVCTRPGQPWVKLDRKIRYMLRFFGRVLPLVQ